MIKRLSSIILFAWIAFFQIPVAQAGTAFSSSSNVAKASDPISGQDYLCIKWGSEMCVRKLLDEGMDPNASVGCGLTVLHLAAAYGRDEVVSLLLSHGADLNRRATGNAGWFESCDFSPKGHKGWSAATFAKYASTPDDLHIAYLRRPVTWRMLTEQPCFDFDSEITFAKQYQQYQYAGELNKARESLASIP